MSGCKNGIELVEVRASNGSPSILFQGLVDHYNGNVDLAYTAYLKTYLPQYKNFEGPRDVNGELFLDSILKSGLIDDPQFFSKQFEEQPERKATGIVSSILEGAKLIIPPSVDENGQEGDSYGITNTPGGAPTKFVQRVSNLIGKFSLRKQEMKDRAGNTYPTLTDAIANREADTLFSGKRADETVTVEGIDYTKQEYIDFKKAVYKQGTIKGDLIHALLQYQTALLNEDSSTANQLLNKIHLLENESATERGTYNWVIEKNNFQAIMKNAGIVIDKKVPSELRDKVYSEIAVANSIMEAGGKIDTMVEKPDGRIKIIDYKTGNRFNNNTLNSRIMNYGSQEFNIYDSSLGRAKLQTMLYSVIIKASHPEAQFEPPVVMHIPNEIQAKSPKNAHEVEVRDYLKMIEQFYRNEQPEVYKQLIEASPKLFDPNEYGASRNTSFTQDMVDTKTGMRMDEMLTKYEVELEQLVTAEALKKSDDPYHRESKEYAKKIAMLMTKISQARTTLRLPKGSSKDYEISKFTQWLGTINDTQNPYIQAYAQIVSQQRAKVYDEYGRIESEFNSKMTKVFEQIYGKQSGLSRALKPVDKQKVFDRLIHKEVIVDETDGQRRVVRGLITEKNEGWNQLSQAEKDLVIFMRTNMKEVFDHVMVNGPNATISYRNNKPRTKLDIYNDSIGSGFKMTDTFIPKMAITSSEVRFKAAQNGVTGAVNYVKHQLAKRLSMFYEENVEGENQNMYGIPVKYLGSGSSYYNDDIHTSNLEVAFKGYMQHMINKKHYDQVYALGDSIKGYLELQSDRFGNPINKNAADFIGYHLHRNLIGRINDTGEGFWRKKFRIAVSPDGREIYFSPAKFMKMVNGGVAAAALWLKIPSAAKNAFQAVWAVSKESMVNSMASTEWGGVDVDKQDLSAKNHAKAYKLWMEYQKDSMIGKGKEHPVHVFIKSFRMFPDMTELGNHSKDRVVDGGTLFNVNHLSVLYSYPEEMTTAVLAMDAMMAMKIKAGPYKGQSMWDVYSSSIVKDPVTGEGRYELPADFSRGKLRMGDGTLQELKGLNPLEISKIHRIIQGVKGGYRTEERSMIESTALGEMFMLFRRWLPASIVRAFKSKQYDPSMGYLAKTEQEDVFEWQAKLTEGRFRTFAGVVGEYLRISKKRGYRWSDLSDIQRKNFIDAAVTFSTFAMTSALIAAAFGDADDEDSLKKWASEANMRIIEQWNFVAMADAATSQPPAVKRSIEILDGIGSLGMASTAYATGGSDEDIYTKRGDIRGLNQILKNIPVAAAYYDAEKFLENTEYWEE